MKVITNQINTVRTKAIDEPSIKVAELLATFSGSGSNNINHVWWTGQRTHHFKPTSFESKYQDKR